MASAEDVVFSLVNFAAKGQISILSIWLATGLNLSPQLILHSFFGKIWAMALLISSVGGFLYIS